MRECPKIGHKSGFVKFHLPRTQPLAGAFFLPVTRAGTGIALPEGTSMATK
jgi:hypothetical protein